MTPEERIQIEGPGGMYVSPPRPISDASAAQYGSFGVWRDPATKQGVYRYTAEDRHRMGNCSWLPEPGDLCVCEKLVGDCFYQYVALRSCGEGKCRRVGRFSAYVFGKLVCVLEDDVFHLWCSGLPVAEPA